MKKNIALLVLVIALGCKNEMATNNTDAGADTATAATASAAPGAAKLADKAAPMPRMIVRTADLSLVISDTAAAVERITAAVNASGGYVADAKLWRDHDEMRGTLTLRVPAASLDATLAAIRKVAKRVQSEAISSDDVSQEYVDLESQVKNLEAAEVEMRGLMTTVTQRTKKAQDILEIYQQLTELRGRIEQAKGRMRYLSQQSAMSAIKVELVPDAVAKPVVEQGWEALGVVKDASRALLHALEGIATFAIWIVIYVLPIVVLIGGAVFVLWRVIVLLRGGAARA